MNYILDIIDIVQLFSGLQTKIWDNVSVSFENDMYVRKAVRVLDIE